MPKTKVQLSYVADGYWPMYMAQGNWTIPRIMR